MTTPNGVPDVVYGLLTAAAGDVTVYDGRVPEEPDARYAVFWPDIGTVRAAAVCGVSDDAVFRWQVTSVAPDRQQAAWLAERLRDAIVDARPIADGWVCGQIVHTYSQQPQHDETVMELPVVYMGDLYEVRAQRVPMGDSSSS